MFFSHCLQLWFKELKISVLAHKVPLRMCFLGQVWIISGGKSPTLPGKLQIAATDYSLDTSMDDDQLMRASAPLIRLQLELENRKEIICE